MKNANSNIEREIDQIIQSGMNKNRVDTSPFFTTRIMGKIEQLDNDSVLYQKFAFILKPAMLVIIFINVFNFYVYNQSSYFADNQTDQLEFVMNEYVAASNDFIISDDFLIEK